MCRVGVKLFLFESVDEPDVLAVTPDGLEADARGEMRFAVPGGRAGRRFGCFSDMAKQRHRGGSLGRGTRLAAGQSVETFLEETLLTAPNTFGRKPSKAKLRAERLPLCYHHQSRAHRFTAKILNSWRPGEDLNL
jgi:hypothetical protein